MNQQTWNRVKQLYGDASELPPPERAAFLDALRGEDVSIRVHVESLLAADEDAGKFLEHASADVATDGSSVFAGQLAANTNRLDVPPGTRVGRYSILERLGEGGFGTVYRAEQLEPVRRRVALKLIKPGMDSREVITRFEAERQALALMDHPYIARVFDGGVTDSARPYFVMELVEGVPITQYCDDRQLSTTERLEMFRRVCEAVQHAHQKGVIHRDIKPSNVLVARDGETASPKVIDFGVAKAIHSPLTDHTQLTQHEQVLGTPAYMSPEQAAFDRDIDTRTDVYALGVLLYELLTGTTPFDSQRLRQASLTEMQRVIREVEPHRPSTQVSQLDERRDEIAKRRKTDPDALTRRLRGDLDWIVMRALEKDRTRRYPSAAEFAEDIRRHLDDEPVLAGPPTAGYRFRKFARRHRGSLLAGSALVVTLALGTVLSTIGFLRAESLRLRAVDAETNAVAEKNAAQQAREAAESARDESEAVVQFFRTMLEEADPQSARGNDVTVRSLLDQSAAAISEQYAGSPIVEARLRTSIGVTYWSLAVYDKAEEQLLAAMDLIAANHGDERLTYNAANALGNVYQAVDRFDEAEAAYRQALDIAERTAGADSEQVMMEVSNLGTTLTKMGHYDEAETYLLRAFDAAAVEGPDSIRRLHATQDLAQLYYMSGNLAKSEKYYREVLERRRKVLPPDHPDTALSLRGLGQVLVDGGRLDEAEPLIREALDIERRVHGRHPQTAMALSNLADLVERRGDLDGAEKLLLEAESIQRETLGDKHSDLATTLNNLAGIYWRQKRLDDAERVLRESIEIHRATSGDEHPFVASGMGNLAILLYMTGQVDESLETMQQVIDLQQRRLGDSHPDVLRSMRNLASMLSDAGHGDEAESVAREALRRSDADLPEGHIDRTYSRTALGEILLKQKRYEEAEPLLLESYDSLRDTIGAANPRTAEVLNKLIELYEGWDRPADADKWRAVRDGAE